MSMTLPLYEGDSIIHRPSARNISIRQPQAAVGAAPHAARTGGLLRLYRAIGRVFVKAGDWLEQTSSDARGRDLEAYLSRSTDHADLERRMRDLERRTDLPFPYI